MKQAAALLHPGRTRAAPLTRAARAALRVCGEGGRAKRVRCLLRRRYRRDRRAAALAIRIYELGGTVVGLEPAQRMNGGWRGWLTLVPHLPTGWRRRHLRWLLAAFRDYRKLEAALKKHARAAGTRVRYRLRPLALRFFRSVGRGTPSAYANDWTVAWNVNGSLLRTARGVRETLWHEVFHLNDDAHQGWSKKALGALHAAIIKRCTRHPHPRRPRGRRHARLSRGRRHARLSRRRRHARLSRGRRHARQSRGRRHARLSRGRRHARLSRGRRHARLSRGRRHARQAQRSGKRARGRLSNRCLRPYAPHKTKVRGKTYYAFHPESGVGEYAAELAVRYYREHRAVLARRPPRHPFKCRRPENARAWKRLAKEFFGGVDRVPACER